MPIYCLIITKKLKHTIVEYTYSINIMSMHTFMFDIKETKNIHQ